MTCGLAAGAWLGAAEAPTKLVTAGFSPFIGMVAGVVVARWTVPTLVAGTGASWATCGRGRIGPRPGQSHRDAVERPHHRLASPALQASKVRPRSGWCRRVIVTCGVVGVRE